MQIYQEDLTAIEGNHGRQQGANAMGGVILNRNEINPNESVLNRGTNSEKDNSGVSEVSEGV